MCLLLPLPDAFIERSQQSHICFPLAADLLDREVQIERAIHRLLLLQLVQTRDCQAIKLPLRVTAALLQDLLSSVRRHHGRSLLGKKLLLRVIAAWKVCYAGRNQAAFVRGAVASIVSLFESLLRAQLEEICLVLTCQ